MDAPITGRECLRDEYNNYVLSDEEVAAMLGCAVDEIEYIPGWYGVIAVDSEPTNWLGE